MQKASLYVYNEERKSIKLKEYTGKNEHQAIEQYLKDIGKKADYTRILGESRGMVYGLHFKMSIDGTEKEYMVIVANWLLSSNKLSILFYGKHNI